MDPQASSPEHDPLNFPAILDNAIIGRVNGNEFSNAARDTIKLTVNNYNVTPEGENLVFDVINHLQKAVPLCLAEVRKNDQSRSTLAETLGADASDPVHQVVTADQTLEGDPVDIMDIMPLEPSSLPVVSIADRYTRSMLKCLAGYPLYEPQPFSELSTEYLRNGVNVGDVGFVRGDGTFDFLFNICPSKNTSINPSTLPDGFSLETSECSATRAMRPRPRETYLFQTPITRTNSGEYICEGADGAILELPEGAIEHEATNIRPFTRLAARHGVQWYEYTMTRGREISNGSLYLITSFTKCAHWGIAVFDRPCASGQGLRFDKKRSFPFGKSKYLWNGSRVFPTKVSDPIQGDTPNQCVFLRGYKIMIRQDIFDNLCNDQPHRSQPATPSSSLQAGSSNLSLTRQRAARIRGGGGPDPALKTPAGGSLWSPTTMPAMAKSDEVVLHPNFNSSLVHPSDFINAELLSQNPNAKVALTHDDVWCNLLRDNFPKFNYARLINIARSYTNTVHEYDCVSLQKISDSSNVLAERSHPLQGTETPALQGPVTTPNEDYTSVSYMISMPLPRELVERILFLLDTEAMMTCRLVNRGFNEIIQSSTGLRYFLACKAAGVIDNPQSPLTYFERLKALLKRENAWRALKPVFETTIKVNHRPSPAMIYGLAGGAYFLDNKNLTDLNYCRLPSSPQDNPRWLRIPGHGPGEGSPGIFNNFGMAIYEHDLIINVICTDTGNQADMQRHSLDLVLLKFSTGEYHPLARHPRIHVKRFPEARPAITPEIVGDNLALVVYSRAGTFPDELFIFDWKTGHKRLQHEATVKAYSGLVFLSPELLLVPNLILSHFEVWHLPPSHPNADPPVQILSLKIPSISRKYSLFEVSCSGEPNPFLHSMPYFPPRPFFTSRENSIIIVNLVISPNSPRGSHSSYYTLIMHRHTLLDTIQKWTSSSFLEQQDLEDPPRLTNEVTVHKIADPEDESVILGAQSKLVPMRPSRHPPRTRSSSNYASSSRSFLTSHLSADSGSPVSSGASIALSTSRYNFLPVQWADWGPPISRWLRASEIQGQLIATSAGQRYAFAVHNPRDSRKLMVSVADFNPYHVRKDAAKMVLLRGGSDTNGSGNNSEGKQEEEEELEKLNHGGVFSEDVYMGLKCVIYHAPDEYDFDQLLMDEERLLGLKLDDEGRDESIKILYFG